MNVATIRSFLSAPLCSRTIGLPATKTATSIVTRALRHHRHASVAAQRTKAM
jgi:hypothetical protein